MAEVVAATHDAYKTTDAVAADAHGHDVAVGFCLGEFYIDGVVTVFALRYHVGQIEITVRTAH